MVTKHWVIIEFVIVLIICGSCKPNSVMVSLTAYHARGHGSGSVLGPKYLLDLIFLSLLAKWYSKRSFLMSEMLKKHQRFTQFIVLFTDCFIIQQLKDFMQEWVKFN